MEHQAVYENGPGRIRFLKEKGRLAEALEEIRRGLERNPGDLQLKTSLADLFLRQGRLAEGRILTEEVLAQDPGHPQALSLLGDLLIKERSYDQALECYRQAYNREPRPYLILKSARALRALGKPAEALEELEKVLVVNPQNIPFLNEKAFLLNSQNKQDQALEVLKKIKSLRPEDSLVQKEILRLRGRTRPPAQVLKELQAVVGMESKKDNAEMHGLLAQQLKNTGKVREAAAEYRTASRLEPQNTYYLKQEGFCHYHLKEFEQAAALLGEAFRRNPGDFYVRGALEKSYQALGNLKGWLELLEEVSRQHPDQKSLWGIIRKIRKKTGAGGEAEK